MHPSAMLVAEAIGWRSSVKIFFKNFLKLHKEATVEHYFFSRAVSVQPAKLLEGRQFVTGKKF